MRLRGQNLHLPPDRAAKPIPGVLDMSVTRGFSHSLGHKATSFYHLVGARDTVETAWLFVNDMSALLRHRTFHQQHHGYQRQRHNGQDQKDIEIRK